MRGVQWGFGVLLTILLLAGAGTRLAADQASDPQEPAQKPEEPPLSGGLPFSTEPEAPNEGEPLVVADGAGRVYRLWIRAVGEKGRGGQVLFMRSEDEGLTWPKEAMVLPDARHKGRTDGQAITPQLVLGPDRELYAVWRTKYRTPNDRMIRFQRSADAGSTWVAESRTLNQAEAGFEPQVALGPQGRVYVAWSDERRAKRFDIFFMRAEERGNRWSTETQLTQSPDQGDSPTGSVNFRPRLASDPSGQVYLTWVSIGARGSSVFFRRSTDFGATWEPPVNVGGGGTNTTSQTLLQDGQGRFVLVWNARRPDPAAPLGVHLSRSDDAGKQWVSPVRIGHPPATRRAEAAFPEVASGPHGEIYVVWQDSRNGRADIYFNRSLDRGKSWLSEDVRIDRDEPGTAISQLPRIAVNDSGVIAVAWEDDRAGFAGIYLALSSDGGKSWREMRVDKDTPERTEARVVRLAWGPKNVLHLIWENQKRLSVSDVQKSVRYQRLAIPPVPRS